MCGVSPMGGHFPHKTFIISVFVYCIRLADMAGLRKLENTLLVISLMKSLGDVSGSIRRGNKTQ